MYKLELFPFGFHRLSPNKIVAISESGDYIFLTQEELYLLVHQPSKLNNELLADLKSKYFLGEINQPGLTRLLASRIAEKKETILSGPSLHIIVTTLQCTHSCRYCQVSRSLDDKGFSMPIELLDKVCETIFESPSQTLAVEFQGGDPLLRFDLLKHAIERINIINKIEKRNVRFIVASTLHQLNDEMCAFFKNNNVILSTSLDGPKGIHNSNRIHYGNDSYEFTVKGLDMARRKIGYDSVSALMTTTRQSLQSPEDVVDEYVTQGFNEIFLRPLSLYGFALRNPTKISYSVKEFTDFYRRAFDRILFWNNKGIQIREVTASIILNKILSTFDAGYVDLQSPSGFGLAVLVYNYDGYIYPSDEARMLTETGDNSLRLGKIGDSLNSILSSNLAKRIIKSSLAKFIPGCMDCAFNKYCGPDPINAFSQFGFMEAPAFWTKHCIINTWMFEFFFALLEKNEPEFIALANAWAKPNHLH